MKKLPLLITCLAIIISCNNQISKKDLEGVWWNLDKVGDFEIIFKNGFGMPYTGKYTLKKDSISIIIDNITTTDYIKFNQKDSSLTLKNEQYYKVFECTDSLKIVNQDFNFINIKSNKTIHLDSLNKSDFSIFKAFKNKKEELKVVLNDKIATIHDVPAFLTPSCTNGKPVYHKPYLLLGKNLIIKNLNEIYLNLQVINHYSIRIITYYDFPNRLFHYYDIKIDLFKEELLKHGPPPTSHNMYRTYYISKFNPKFLKIKSKKDFEKLNSIKPNTNYLISIHLDLPIKDYLNLNQKLNSIRRNKKIRIRTELIDF